MDRRRGLLVAGFIGLFAAYAVLMGPGLSLSPGDD